MSLKNIPVDLLIKYGLQVLGAIVILGVGLLLARWVGNLVQKGLQRQDMEPPIRTLLVRFIKVLVIAFTLVVALDTFGVKVAPLIAGIGIAGVGIGIALQGVLFSRNRTAWASISKSPGSTGRWRRSTSSRQNWSTRTGRGS